MRVVTQPGSPQAKLHTGGHVFNILIGRNGAVEAARKREGDGHTPQGTYPLIRGLYRPDRVPPPPQNLPWQALSPTMGWCDAPTHPRYNHPVNLPFEASHETLWREDTAYDHLIVIGHNHPQAVAHMGSAIFIHVWHPGKTHTEGCLALTAEDMQTLLPLLSTSSTITIT